MQKKEIVLRTYGLQNYDLHGIIWMPNKNKPIHKVIHIVHGMTEHIGRYEAFAEAMTSVGIAVAGFDLRGHGRNSGDPECTAFISGGQADMSDYGWHRSLEDIKRQIIEIRTHIPEADYYLMGFSLGSFLVRDYMRKIPTNMNVIKGIILMGTGYTLPIITVTMKAVVKGEIKKATVAGTTPMIRKLAFETYNKKFEPVGTTMDWLCSDTEQLDKYMADPLIRKDISADLFYEMLNCMDKVNRPSAYTEENDLTNVSILLMSGSNDAVGDMGKSIETIALQMDKAGIKSVTTAVIPNARHDILHEYRSGAANYAIDIIKNWLG